MLDESLELDLGFYIRLFKLEMYNFHFSDYEEMILMILWPFCNSVLGLRKVGVTLFAEFVERHRVDWSDCGIFKFTIWAKL